MSYNTRSPAVKRLMREAQELAEPTELFHAQPLEDNLFEWHFTIRGPSDSDFEGGIYHGRIILPTEYPMKPPNIVLLTPNGRFEINKKICLSISGFHPESWRPCWSIRTALLGIIGFMPTHGIGAIGSLDYPSQERKNLSRASVDFKCQECGPIKNILKAQTEASKKDTEEARDLAKQMAFKDESSLKAAVVEQQVTNQPDVTVSTTLSQQAVPLFTNGNLNAGIAGFSNPYWPYWNGLNIGNGLAGVTPYSIPNVLGAGGPAMFNFQLPAAMPPIMSFEEWLCNTKGIGTASTSTSIGQDTGVTLSSDNPVVTSSVPTTIANSSTDSTSIASTSHTNANSIVTEDTAVKMRSVLHEEQAISSEDEILSDRNITEVSTQQDDPSSDLGTQISQRQVSLRQKEQLYLKLMVLTALMILWIIFFKCLGL